MIYTQMSYGGQQLVTYINWKSFLARTEISGFFQIL
jgi:hypothetical protein